uniref:Synaptonemal complex central element protein 2 n=1 Tax=Dicentrarchus labrax TaxID=13489 RepID=A0A8P4G000_DICLA
FRMDFFFEDLPSTSQSTPKSRHEESQMTFKVKATSTYMYDNIYCSSRIDDISRRVQDLVEKINDSRTSDQTVMDSFQEKLMEKVTEMCQQMKEHMYTVYEENSNEMQVKLQELSEVLESCTKLNTELMEATNALAGLREGLAISKMSEP